MIKIGGRDLLLSISLLIPEDEVAQLQLDTEDGDPLDIEIQFLNDSDKDAKPSVSVNGEGTSGIIKFINWRNSLGQSLFEPVRLASSEDGSSITFLASSSFNGDLNELFIQFMKERADD